MYIPDNIPFASQWSVVFTEFSDRWICCCLYYRRLSGNGTKLDDILWYSDLLRMISWAIDLGRYARQAYHKICAVYHTESNPQRLQYCCQLFKKMESTYTKQELPIRLPTRESYQTYLCFLLKKCLPNTIQIRGNVAAERLIQRWSIAKSNQDSGMLASRQNSLRHSHIQKNCWKFIDLCRVQLRW